MRLEHTHTHLRLSSSADNVRTRTQKHHDDRSGARASRKGRPHDRYGDDVFFFFFLKYTSVVCVFVLLFIARMETHLKMYSFAVWNYTSSQWVRVRRGSSGLRPLHCTALFVTKNPRSPRVLSAAASSTVGRGGSRSTSQSSLCPAPRAPAATRTRQNKASSDS